MEQLRLGELVIDVEQKDIKNIHLSVYPPTGKVRIAAPLRMDLDTIRVYALSKVSWIRKQQAKLKGQEREAPREFLTRESHYFRGKRYLLQVIEFDAPPRVELQHSKLVLYVRPDSTFDKKQEVLEEWYRVQLKIHVADLIEKWEKIMNVKVNEFGIKKMKTKWGTCNREAQRIWLNLELAKKPPECLEYIVVHEMVHLHERNHNDRFIAFMNQYLPKWQLYKEVLNRLPVKQESWVY
ncbi:metal-dependent hydrolase [Paenibacillus agaridevorans]|uniref:Metal-dependent hydrolase n=1 Tax=Paenibacillus agaridevorans TaxID=171404 RepID=A0A2R5EIJ5_9BACL|nr:SprT family zinc-dependent metalloprotease [Paenibacillus agaridevorans]GBG05905.1 metal-dependent hydrolase [Paenibacillus agaridevorans]